MRSFNKSPQSPCDILRSLRFTQPVDRRHEGAKRERERKRKKTERTSQLNRLYWRVKCIEAHKWWVIKWLAGQKWKETQSEEGASSSFTSVHFTIFPSTLSHQLTHVHSLLSLLSSQLVLYECIIQPSFDFFFHLFMHTHTHTLSIPSTIVFLPKHRYSKASWFSVVI